jgi:MYXO-CTERM domain-containing protein
MSGNMVSTTPPTPSSPTALDGFANLDAVGRTASVLFGGTSDGTVQLVVTGVHAAPFFGSTVHAVVEHTPFVNRTTPVTVTNMLSTADLVVSNDAITVTVTGANATDGYRVVLTATGDGGAMTGMDAGAGGGDGGAGRADGGAVTDAGTGRGDAGGVRDAQAVADAHGVGDATAGSSDGASPGRGVDEGGSGVDAAAASSSGGASSGSGDGEEEGQGSAGGCSCRVGERSRGSAGWGLVGLLPLLLVRGRRRGSGGR